MLSFADKLPGPYGFERSIKFIGSQIFRDRFLLSFPKVALSMGADFDCLLSELSFPAPASQGLQALLAEGDILHLGFEGETSAYVCKLYVENAQRIRQLWDSPLSSAGNTDTINVHRALKWWPCHSPEVSLVEAHYDWLPCADQQALLAGISDLCPREAKRALVDLLLLAAQKVPARDLQLLQVSEPGSVRKSFDLNLYDACLALADVQSILTEMLVACGAEPESVNKTLSPLAHETLGHIAGGVTRNGQSFLSIYFGGAERGSFNG
ncbi:MAG: hypothetical protein KBT88_03610 [Gammaproteobacteria bacterium]|nr:hypothetical protein [Gammaproteobacteria bacterium]MBQ0838848.1 hypothetical protein [Gammaproteobacteria bacterium]